MVESSSIEKLLGIQIDSDLTFDEHISSICNKVGKKINVLSRLVNYMSLDKHLMMIMKALKPILDAVLKQGVLRLFQYGSVRLGTPLI